MNGTFHLSLVFNEQEIENFFTKHPIPVVQNTSRLQRRVNNLQKLPKEKFLDSYNDFLSQYNKEYKVNDYQKFSSDEEAFEL